MFDYRKVISFLLTHFVSLVLLLIGFNIVLENSWCYVMYNFSNKSCVISCKLWSIILLMVFHRKMLIIPHLLFAFSRIVHTIVNFSRRLELKKLNTSVSLLRTMWSETWIDIQWWYILACTEIKMKVTNGWCWGIFGAQIHPCNW